MPGMDNLADAAERDLHAGARAFLFATVPDFAFMRDDEQEARCEAFIRDVKAIGLVMDAEAEVERERLEAARRFFARSFSSAPRRWTPFMRCM